MKNQILALALLAACGDNNDPIAMPDAGTAVDSSIDAPPAPIRAVVVAGDFMTAPGVLSVLDLETRTVTMNAGPAMAVGKDPVLRKFGNELFIINRAENNITILDADDLSLVEQIGTGAGTNPQDVAVVGTKLFVATYENKGMVELTRGSTTAVEIDLGADDTDGKPNCNSVYLAAGKLYVACELLDGNFAPRGPGKVYVVDPSTRGITSTLTLSSVNPFGLFEQIPEFAPHAGDLVIPTVNFADNGGCVERITTGNTPAAAGCMVTNTAMGNFAGRVDFYAPQFTGPVNGSAIAIPQVMYAVVPRTDFMGSNLRIMDLADNTVRADAVNPSTQALVDVAACPDDRLVVSDAAASPTAGAGGLRVYRGSLEQTTAALPVGLKPSSSHGLVCY